MHKKMHTAALFLLGSVLMPMEHHMAIAANAGLRANYADAGEALDEAIGQQLKKYGIHGIAVALVDDQRIVHLAGLGDAKPNSIFRAGSISKLFNALAIMQLVEKGRLDLEAPIERYGQQFSIVNPFDGAPPITLRMLLCHRSGMIRESPVGGYLDPSQPALSEMVASVRSCVLIDPPNTKTRYSNVGPSIAGQIASTVAGMPYEQLQQEKVLGPVGMTSSSFLTKGVPRERLSAGYMRIADDRGGFHEGEAPVFDLGTLPAGNLWTTAEDLAKFISMLAADGRAGGKQIVSQKTLEEMWKPQLLAGDAGFGIAFRVGKFRNHKSVGHMGAVYGHTASVALLPESKIGVVLLSNEDIAIGPLVKLTNLALSLMVDAKLGERPPTPLAPREVTTSELDALAGDYESPSNWARIDVVAGKLVGNIGGQPIELTPRGTPTGAAPDKSTVTAFVANGRLLDDAPINFDRDSSGQGIAFHAIEQKFTRLDPRAIPPIPPSWSEFTGVYGSDFIPLVISVRHGHLYASIENEYDYRLMPVSRNAFRCPPGMYNEEPLLFLPDANGKTHGASIANMYLMRREAR
jgi:CubicO group peptidase (beta-lactamase class C family)